MLWTLEHRRRRGKRRGRVKRRRRDKKRSRIKRHPADLPHRLRMGILET
jgi:hypothetical protein